MTRARLLAMVFATVLPSTSAADPGWGVGSTRLGLSGMRQHGTHPNALVAGEPVAHARTGLTLDADVLHVFGRTRYETAIGGEILTRTGLRGMEDRYFGSSNRGRFFTRADAALDVFPLSWNGALSGRVGVGGGFGFEIDTGRWFPGWGRAYPLVLARLQLFFDTAGLHLSWHYLPTTTNRQVQWEHRVEAAVSYGRLHAGVRFARTEIREDGEAHFLQELGAFVGFAL